ncbi:MAG: hypothetical protein PHN41_06475 [Bacteroidales bacterium]|nr:hypothetical protein [Bacteroidales bacterium]
MATYNATIDRLSNNSKTLKLLVGTDELNIVLTDDNPNEVKTVFNKLLLHLKNGEIEFNLLDDETDLYNNICREYIIQLNSELKSTYNELRDNGLLNEV